ncbi:MAG TPA: [FeFe] hydrogenase H-cluster radical SAM maturase HydE [Candidatus Ozemobacteraceae bacterium]
MQAATIDNTGLIAALVNRERISDDLARHLFSPAFDDARPELYAAADRVRRETVGDHVYIRGIIEFSNYCRCQCDYCGISCHNPEISRYRMTHDEVLETASHAHALGYRSLVLQSGEDRAYRVEDICHIIESIKSRLDMAVTLSIGEWSREEYAAFRAAGADRYLLRIETSSQTLYERFHRDSKWHERHQALMDLKELGYQVGSGILIGLPGQDGPGLIRDLEYLERLRPEMVGIGPFIPHPQTPLGNQPAGLFENCLTFLALLRLYLPDAFLPATTAMGTVDPIGRQKALKAGANVIMPNVSPVMNRPSYQIYPNKICQDDDVGKCQKCVQSLISALGRIPDFGHGHIRRSIY